MTTLLNKTKNILTADETILFYAAFSLDIFIYPALTSSKTPTSKSSQYEEVRWEINCS